jgi:hypothetical protein
VRDLPVLQRPQARQGLGNRTTLRKSRKRIIGCIGITIVTAIMAGIGGRGLVYIMDRDTGITVTDHGTDIGGRS